MNQSILSNTNKPYVPEYRMQIYVNFWNESKEYELYIRFWHLHIRLSNSQRALWFKGRSLINTSGVNHYGFWNGVFNRQPTL